MARIPQLLDPYGRPVKRAELTREVAAATVGSVRTPLTGYPGDGLDPVRLANILREADAGDPVRYLELAETIEERDPHYLGVIGTRKRSVSQLDIAVEPGGETAQDLEIADRIRDWLARGELAEELFHILDAVGKGYSFTEILWNTSSGQWEPERLEWRDPRWFRFERHDLSTPMMLDERGQRVPLPGYKFVFNRMQAKSGLALRGGLARVAAWGWMFKAYTQRDWAIFTQTYGQPLRVGKFGTGASEEDKATLFRAVANIAGDMAAIIPESMTLEFVEAANLGSGHQNYRDRADWLDQQISKAVLGQTATTDSLTGGLGSGKEHREVQEDIERADARQLAAVLVRDLIRPWVRLEWGEGATCPGITIDRPEQEDLAAFASSVSSLVQVGMRVSAQEVRAKFGLSDPGPEDEVLQPWAPQAASPAVSADPAATDPAVKRQSGDIKRAEASSGASGGDGAALQAEAVSAAISAPPDPAAEIAGQLAAEAAPAMGEMIGKIEAMMQAAGSLAELREMLLAGFDRIDASKLEAVMAGAIAAAMAQGRADIEDEGADG